jgi:hypothetical protein
MVITGTNFTVLAYATGGLETQSVATLIVLQTLLAVRYSSTGRQLYLWTWSIASGLALMSRLDTALLLLPVGLFLLYQIIYHNKSWSGRAASLLWLAGPVLTMLFIWLLWKYNYYGSILPNTFFAKAGGFNAMRFAMGMNFSYYFAVFYGLPIVAFFIVAGWRRLAAIDYLILAMIALWLVYVSYTGGDFMEFRPFVPVVPLVAVLAARGIHHSYPNMIWPIAIALAVMSVLHAGRFYMATGERGGIESVSKLQSRLISPGSNWIGIGKRLNEVFYDESRAAELPKIAVNPAGAIPFYAKLPSFDMLGLTSPEVARSGLPNSEKPGHERIATPDQVRAADVDIYLGPTRLVRSASLNSGPLSRVQVEGLFCAGVLDAPEANQQWCDGLLDGAKVLIIPMKDDYRLVTLLLQDNALVNDRVAAGAVSVQELDS